MRRRLALLLTLGIVAAVTLMPSAAAGGGCHPGSFDHEMTTSSDPLVGIGECTYFSTVVYIEPGEEVTWVNKDPVPHTVTGALYSWGTERILETSDRVSYAFEKEGVYPYYCALHPAMVGAVVVGNPTTPAALTNGAADVHEMDVGSGAAATGELDTEPAAETETNPGVSAAIGIAIVATLGLVAFGARLFLPRRKTATSL